MKTETHELPPPFPPPPRLTIEHEVKWADIAPLLDELQDVEWFHDVVVERWSMRTGAGGPGFDIVPILVIVALSQVVIEAVKDAYPKLKAVIFALYRRLPGMTPTGKVYPMAFTISEGLLSAQYRLPEGLSNAEFGHALVSVPSHFASVRHEGRKSLVFTYDRNSKAWSENEEASEFETWLARREADEETSGPL